jgi:hypothetical protein
MGESPAEPGNNDFKIAERTKSSLDERWRAFDAAGKKRRPAPSMYAIQPKVGQRSITLRRHDFKISIPAQYASRSPKRPTKSSLANPVRRVPYFRSIHGKIIIAAGVDQAAIRKSQRRHQIKESA